MSHDDKMWQELHRTQLEYYGGFVDELADFVRDKRASGWFFSREDMLNHYRDKWNDRQQFAAGILWDLASMDEDFSE